MGTKPKRAMTFAQIERQFDSEWVLVRDPVMDRDMNLRAGLVIAHSKDRDDVYRQAIKLRPKKFAMMYVGVLPKDSAVVL